MQIFYSYNSQIQKKVFKALLKAGIVVRNRASEVKNCLRITIGTKIENNQLLAILKDLEG